MPLSLTGLNAQFGLVSQRQYQAGLGAYFTITEPTLGTGVAYALQTGTSATANGLFALANNAAVGGKSVYLDRIQLRQTATAPTGTLAMVFEFINETGVVTMTGNVATRTPVQINTVAGGSQTSVVSAPQAFSAGAATVPAAAGTRRTQGYVNLPTGVAVTHDVYEVIFGADGPQSPRAGLTAARATDPCYISVNAQPIVIAPGTTTYINMYWVTQAANTPSFCYLVGWSEL